MNSKRLFFAIDLPLEIKEKALKLIQKNTLPKSANLTPVENLHLTLLFLGNVLMDDISLIIKIAENVFSCYSPFDLYFKDITVAPNKNYPRMIWLNGEFNETIKQIKDDLEKELEYSKINFQKENRGLKIHITLCRFLPEKFSLDPIAFPAHFKVKEVILMESELKKPHAIYIPLKNFPLNREGIDNNF
ncbi:MAG TPA: RNA 2',3'-cyclic phosphodiesterase [Candidatus Paceibacterota bacterium]|jgi:2'-5' RNA ligase|nr:RNA 2',3'-cyclic phosphodiesterase [Candidatus Paceibacterota bacterium]HRU35916.1 RNA 2',3'-cyclic phosphodiesterase [Candidatus Paceibacterota bacterium]